MNVGSQAPTPVKTSPRLRVARFDDYPEIQRLESSHGLLTLPADDWRGIWRDNPLRPRLGDGWPIGWVLEEAGGGLVGTLTNVPTRYTFRGRDLIAATGRAWVVSSKYRGVALWLMEEYFSQEGVDLFLNTTVNSLAVDAFNAFGSARVPLGDWETAGFWVTGYRGFAGSALRIKGVPLPGLLAFPAEAILRIRDALTGSPLSAPSAGAVVESADHFDGCFDPFWDELLRRNPDKLLCVRDRPTLCWHFAGALRAGQVWIFNALRNGLLRAYCVLKRQDHPSSGLVRMRLVDYQTLEPEDDLLPGLLGAALRRCAEEGIYAFEHLGGGLPKMRAFDRSAPYRRTLASWPFYYKAVDPSLDAELRNPDLWDPSAFDGDSSL